MPVGRRERGKGAERGCHGGGRYLGEIWPDGLDCLQAALVLYEGGDEWGIEMDVKGHSFRLTVV